VSLLNVIYKFFEDCLNLLVFWEWLVNPVVIPCSDVVPFGFYLVVACPEEGGVDVSIPGFQGALSDHSNLIAGEECRII
jgi:hypothetical protein